ncbi:hypothetical protein RSSM_06661 [Rhodopirellula sallentina SM41]|uniref:Uncharacterized protein n=2 Tax=Rhodopirellula TaxID=265488 RepID=M5TRT3_9BACT|nr:hypothetical protein RSSM_06661 [Rhodopirellula sallentina SM41]
MAKSSKHLIIIESDGKRRKFAKLLFTGDGSYSLTAPYHSAKKAVLSKMTVNYDTDEQLIAFGDALELSELDEGRLKITHHRSGFVQYSGDGVRSGLGDDGKPKGLGVFSRPLEEVGSGPAVGAGVQGIEQLEETTKCSKHDLMVDINEIPKLPRSNGVMLELHYFQPPIRRFVFKDSKGRNRIDIIHPAGFIVPMFAIHAPEDCELPGLIGVELYGQKFGYGETGFSLSGPGEKERLNEKGEKVADVLGCIFPRPTDFDGATSLDYKPEEG